MQCGVALRPLELGARLADVVITDCDLSKLYDVRRGCVFDSGGMVPAVLFRRYIVPVYDSCGMIPAVLFRRSSGTIPAVPFRRYRSAVPFRRYHSGGTVPAVPFGGTVPAVLFRLYRSGGTVRRYCSGGTSHHRSAIIPKRCTSLC